MADEKSRVSAEEWVARFAAEMGTAAPSEREFAQLLELAAEAAHSSQRTAAPVACWVLGRTGKPVSEAVEVARRIEVA